jgi:hypothetical protein
MVGNLLPRQGTTQASRTQAQYVAMQQYFSHPKLPQSLMRNIAQLQWHWLSENDQRKKEMIKPKAY